MKDIRDKIFSTIAERIVTAVIISDEEGILSGIAAAGEEANRIGLKILDTFDEGCRIQKGKVIIRIAGTPKQIAKAEETVLGHLAKTSGIATSASRFVQKSGSRMKIISGAWKKMPASIKQGIRLAVSTGGASSRITKKPFIYLDKNYIRMLGGIKSCLRTAAALNGHLRVLQLKGNYQDIDLEACEAAENGADIIFIDTGQISDIKKVTTKLNEEGKRSKVVVAFAGGVNISDIDRLRNMDVDILDVGRAIVDAPLLDMKLEVEKIDNAAA